MNSNTFSIKIGLTLLTSLFFLTGCMQPMIYGVSEAHWRSLTDEQKKTAIESYYKQDTNRSYIYIPSTPTPSYYHPHNTYYYTDPYYRSYDNDLFELQRERIRADYYERRARELEQEQHYTPPPQPTTPPETVAPTQRCGQGSSCRQFKPRL